MGVEIPHHQDVLSATEEVSEVGHIIGWAGRDWWYVDVDDEQFGAVHVYLYCLNFNYGVVRNKVADVNLSISN